jgi:hypothetical protein
MEILLFVAVVFCVLNTILLIAVSASLSKLIKYVVEEKEEDQELIPTKNTRKLVDLPAVGPPTYDLAVFNGEAEPFTDGMDRRLTPTRNWDGISQRQ